MAASADIFTEHERWKQPLAWSAGLHALLFGGVLAYGAMFGHLGGKGWGGGGMSAGAISATLVSTIPLPASATPTQNILANESKGLTQSLPKVKEEAPPEAIPIPDKDSKRRKKAEPRATTQEKPRPVETAENNQVPFGQGGPVSGPYGMFSANNAKGGFGFSGSGGGDFGNRYAWYVRVVQQKVSENWLKYEVDPNIRDASRVYITFDISRSGQPKNLRIEQSSGVPSLDQSAIRALQRIDSFGPLPSDYPGSYVSVEFWFDYKR